MPDPVNLAVDASGTVMVLSCTGSEGRIFSTSARTRNRPSPLGRARGDRPT